jgi:hypothetical protein
MERYSKMDFEDIRCCRCSDAPCSACSADAHFTSHQLPTDRKVPAWPILKDAFRPILHASRHILESSESSLLNLVSSGIVSEWKRLEISEAHFAAHVEQTAQTSPGSRDDRMSIGHRT